MKRSTAVLMAAALLSACRHGDVVTNSYATVAEARQAGATDGPIPIALPPGATEIRAAHGERSDRRWGLFNFTPDDADALRGILGAETPLAGQTIDVPARIEWWPVILRGPLDHEQIAATGLRVYRTRAGDVLVGVNWNQGRAYYWRR
jgi:hypothetical protein